MKTCIVIPARYDSTRLPGKVLLDIGGKPMVQWVYERAGKAKNIQQVIIATDNDLVFQTCIKFGAKCIMTSPNHVSGTDRIGEVALGLTEYDYVINIQADEPLIDPVSIEKLTDFIASDQKKRIVTMLAKIDNENDLFDFNIVKVVKDKAGKALYFSRNVLPAHRDLPYKNWLANHEYYRHIGVYGFERKTLLELIKLEASPLEKAEKLEQLRWLENGYEAYCMKTDDFQIGVDTESDLERIRKLMTI